MHINAITRVLRNQAQGAEQPGATGGAAPGPDFVQRTAQRLAAERGDAAPEPTPQPGEDPRRRTPEPGAGSDELQDDSHALDDFEDDQGPDDQDAPDPDDDDGTPDDDPGEDPEGEEDGTWEQRYKDLQAETTRLQQAMADVDQERAEESSNFLTMSYQVEDSLKDIRQRAEFLTTAMRGNAQRYQNIDWSQVPPDQVQAVQQQAHQAQVMAQNADRAYAQHEQYLEQQHIELRRRQAQVAHARLLRTIPGWREGHKEVLGKVRDFAAKSGMDPRAFNDMLDPVVIEWGYQAMQMAEAADGVKKQPRNRNKARQPRSHTRGTRQPRSVDGKFKKAAKQFNEQPNKQTFHEKTAARLARENR